MSYSLTELHAILAPCCTAGAAAEYGMRYIEDLDWNEKSAALQDLRHYMTVQTGIAMAMPSFRATPHNPTDAERKEWHPGATHWICTFRMGTKRMSVPYHMGAAHKNPPTMWEVLTCLFMDAESTGESFASWASDMGMGTDSRKAEATWKACRSIAKRLEALFGDKLEVFRELSRDV